MELAAEWTKTDEALMQVFVNENAQIILKVNGVQWEGERLTLDPYSKRLPALRKQYPAMDLGCMLGPYAVSRTNYQKIRAMQEQVEHSLAELYQQWDQELLKECEAAYGQRSFFELSDLAQKFYKEGRETREGESQEERYKRRKRSDMIDILKKAALRRESPSGIHDEHEANCQIKHRRIFR